MASMSQTRAAPLGGGALSPPRPLPAVAALLRVLLQGEGDLLSLLPAKAYRVDPGWLGWSRRSILIVNKPEWVRAVLADEDGIFPKSDLMTGALEPLIGDSIFVSSGETWRRQRRMVAPAFSQLRVNDAFEGMAGAVAKAQARLDRCAQTGETFSIELAMSHLTADVICRSVFSTDLSGQAAQDVYEAFKVFERSAAHVELSKLIFDPPFKEIAQHAEVLEACVRIRRRLLDLVEPHLAPDAAFSDIASDVIAARDEETGRPFGREELIDQLGVFFLAGHETTASALTWVFYLLAQSPALLARLRDELDAVVGGGPITYDQVQRLSYVRAVIKETLRLYPPITFLPRVALKPTTIGRFRLRRGAMVMIAPWAVHRHKKLWERPNDFDPDRFAPENEAKIAPGMYIPFGQGPRICVGANFSLIESALILASLARRYDFEMLDADRVRPAARLTTRPVKELMCRVRRRG